ncbi:hypothetical protein CXB51_017522 [Gossypium anomalum]|uniref:Myb/SANT-like domain-containing protein n=1 Tax=Gossypium anomalum TaxID=47600 RepID=A0A8J5YT69_9ROSI|nr:hypothetical protein CXB51_017522 [Gossypium anomalum]
MSDFSQLSVSSQNSRGTKRKWVLEEDAVLVACMVDLYNIGTYNADTGFKAGNLNELERMLEKVLPHVMLKAKPNLELMIRTLKRDWAIVYNCSVKKTIEALVGTSIGRWLLLKMLCGTHICSYKAAGKFRHPSFPYYDKLTSIYAKDSATGKDAKTATYIVEEIDAEDVVTVNNLEERNNYRGCEDDVFLG